MEESKKVKQLDMDNMQVIKALSQKCFKKNKLRNGVVLLTIAIFTALLTALIILAQSTVTHLKETLFLQNGSYAHVTVYDLPQSTVDSIEASSRVKVTGKSMVVGLIKNNENPEQSYEVRWGNPEYIAGRFIRPSEGRMPMNANEIVMDRNSLQEMGLSEEIGSSVDLSWYEMERQSLIQGKFILVGIIDGPTDSFLGAVWISTEYINQNSLMNLPTEMDLYFSSSKHISQEMDLLMDEIGNNQLIYEENWVYDSSITPYILSNIKTYIIAMALVAFSAALIIYNIFQISISTDYLFYGRLKTIGATPRQISNVLYGQVNRLCLIGIPLGIVLGGILGWWMIAVLLGSILHDSGLQLSALFIPVAVAGTYITILVATYLPIKSAGKVSPAEALRRSGTPHIPKNRGNDGKSPAILFQMSLANLGREKRRTFITVFSLTLGMVLLCSIHAVNTGFDINKYIANFAISDFTLSDESVVDYRDVYNPEGKTISEDMINEIEGMNGVISTGRLYSQETDIELSNKAYKNLVDYYEADDQEILNYMSYDVMWTAGYNRMRENREAIALLYGIDGVGLEVLIQSSNIIEGKFDAEEFAKGGYVIAEGIAPNGVENKNQPTYGIGETIIIDGKQFEIMVIVDAMVAITEGRNGDKAAFSLPFYIQTSEFKKIYPDNTIRKYFIDVEKEQIPFIEGYLVQKTSEGLPVISRESLIQEYKEQTKASTVMWMVISIIIGVIGMINFVNSIVTAILLRKKELTMMQSIGLEKGQLMQMLIFEGLAYAGFTLILSYVCCYAMVTIAVKSYLDTMWVATYQFTLLPLIICTPLIIVLAALVSLLCYRKVVRSSMKDQFNAERVMEST